MVRNTLFFTLLLSAILLLFSFQAQGASELFSRFSHVTAAPFPSAQKAYNSPQIMDILKPENFLDELLNDDLLMEDNLNEPLPRLRKERGLQPLL